MPNFDLKLFEKAIINVRAKVVQGDLGANPMYKKAADVYARLFEIHGQQVSYQKEMQKLDMKNQDLMNEAMRAQGAMEVMEGILAEELLNSGAELKDLKMEDVAKIAGEMIKSKRTPPDTANPPEEQKPEEQKQETQQS